MVVSSNREGAERLKLELEARKVCDVADIHHTANPKKLLEELIINKGRAEYDYKMFIIDDDAIEWDYDLAENLKHNFPGAHILMLSTWEKPKLRMISKAIYFVITTNLVCQ